MKKRLLILSVTVLLLVVLVFSIHVFWSSLFDLSQESSVPSSLKDSGIIDNSTIPNNLPLIGVNYENQYLFWDFLNKVVGLDTGNYAVDQFCETREDEEGAFGSVKSSIGATLSNKQATINIVMNISERKIRFYDLNVASGALEGSSLRDKDFLDANKNVLEQYRMLNQDKTFF